METKKDNSDIMREVLKYRSVLTISRLTLDEIVRTMEHYRSAKSPDKDLIDEACEGICSVILAIKGCLK